MRKVRTALPALLLVAMLVMTACGASATSAATATAASQQPDAQQAVTSLNTGTITTTAATSAGNGSDLETIYSTVYEQVNPSVVNVTVTAISTSSGGGFGFPSQPRQTTGQASGFVWDTQGNIVTNNHVIEGATSVEVTFYDDVTVSARVVGTDPDSDLAVVKVDPSLHELAPVKLADFQTLKVGQIVMAIGNPYGLHGTLTTGVISAMGRELPVSNTDTTSSASYSIPDVIQTDAAINPGNSGGPLLNVKGEVVGVNTAIESNDGSSAGVGFAVPVAIVQRVIPALVKDGAYHHPWLGVTVMTMWPEIAEAMDLPTNQRGALVVGVTQGSPAETAGLESGSQTVDIEGQTLEIGGDVIIAIDGKAVTKSDDLISYLVRETFVGQEVTLTVLRDGAEITLKAVLAPRPTSGNTLTRRGDSTESESESA